MEVLGLALPYNGTALAVSDQRREMIRQAAFRLVENIKMMLNLATSQDAIDDAFALDMAMGGSTNTVHTLAIANEAVLTDLAILMKLLKTPYLSKIAPVLLILCTMFMKQVASQLL